MYSYNTMQIKWYRLQVVRYKYVVYVKKFPDRNFHEDGYKSHAITLLH